VFVTAAERLGVRPERCLVFEIPWSASTPDAPPAMRVIGVTTAHTAAELTEAGAEQCITTSRDVDGRCERAHVLGGPLRRARRRLGDGRPASFARPSPRDDGAAAGTRRRARLRRGHDARLLARHGYDVVGFDFSPAALEAARALAKRDGVDVTFEQRDVFTLGRDQVNAFDGLWEYTCYCAIDPRRRREYVDTVATILKPGGWLLACFFPVRRGGAGPPFPWRGRGASPSRAALPHRVGGAAAAPGRAPGGQEWMVLAAKTC